MSSDKSRSSFWHHHHRRRVSHSPVSFSRLSSPAGKYNRNEDSRFAEAEDPKPIWKKEQFAGSLHGSIVQNLSGGIEQLTFGEKLDIIKLPSAFTIRYVDLVKKIYIRRCYRDLYDIATANMIRNQLNFSVTLFTGVPGIGKSMFMIYFIYRYLSDARFEDKRFVVEFKPGICDLYTPMSDGSLMHSLLSAESIPQVPVFADIKDNREPEGHGKCLLIFASPSPTRYKGWLKVQRVYKYILPTWSYNEMLFIGSHEKYWYPAFIKYGGVPSIIFSFESDRILDNTVHLYGPNTVKSFIHGFGDLESNMNYMLIHMNPPISLQGDKILYHENPVYTFASDYIFLKLAEKHKNIILSQVKSVINAAGVSSEVYGEGTAGHYFEKILLWLEPMSGHTIIIKSLKDQSMITSIQLPDTDILHHQWKKLAKDSDSDYNNTLMPDILYQSPISNLESGDAFCVIKDGNKEQYTLIVLQVTVAKNHPIKMNGLVDIVSSYSMSIQDKIHQKYLVFVKPKISKLCTIQPLHNQKNKVIKPENIDDRVKDFEQFICNISLSELCHGKLTCITK